ncbi:hypothetical protein ACHAXA_001415 [Cyclostephanos tholiformis]|uniref:Uncharacterized protein n=1 Tax=Cyclostephanos tholiformis TaxID=382380 RepID=A0ABD3R9E9_9STRA
MPGPGPIPNAELNFDIFWSFDKLSPELNSPPNPEDPFNMPGMPPPGPDPPTNPDEDKPTPETPLFTPPTPEGDCEVFDPLLIMPGPGPIPNAELDFDIF